MQTEPGPSGETRPNSIAYRMTAQIEEGIQNRINAAGILSVPPQISDGRPGFESDTAPVRKKLRAHAYANLRDEDIALGRLAVRQGCTTETKVHRALRMQEVAYEKGGKLPSRLGEILVGSRFLTPPQLIELLALQAGLPAVGRAVQQSGGPPGQAAPPAPAAPAGRSEG